MKKISGVLLIMIFLTSVTACGQTDTNPVDPSPIVTDSQISSPEYISNQGVFFYINENLHRFLFTFENDAGKEIAHDATVEVRIVNDDGVSVFQKTYGVTESNFSMWGTDAQGRNLSVPIVIPNDEIEPGFNSKGKLYYRITAGSSRWDELNLLIDNLPIDISFDLPTTPLTVNRNLSSGTRSYSVKITNINYEYALRSNGNINLKFLFDGEKIYDRNGDNHFSAARVRFILYDDEGFSVESGSFLTASLSVNDKFRNVESFTIFDLKPGLYKLVIIENQQ